MLVFTRWCRTVVQPVRWTLIIYKLLKAHYVPHAGLHNPCRSGSPLGAESYCASAREGEPELLITKGQRSYSSHNGHPREAQDLIHSEIFTFKIRMVPASTEVLGSFLWPGTRLLKTDLAFYNQGLNSKQTWLIFLIILLSFNQHRREIKFSMPFNIKLRKFLCQFFWKELGSSPGNESENELRNTMLLICI